MQNAKPTLLVQTVYFERGEEEVAARLGRALYHHLTRNPDDKLAFGPGIPVRVAARADRVDPSEAVHVVLVPVLGAETCQDGAARAQALATLTRWQTEVAPNAVVLPLLTADCWRRLSDQVPGELLLDLSAEDARDGFEHTVLTIVIEICRRMAVSDPAGVVARPSIFVSHADAETEPVAEKIRDLARRAPVARAFETAAAPRGLTRQRRLEQVARAGLFIAVHSDQYASRHLCQLELLTAKRAGVSTLSVEMLAQGEARSYPYAGNAPTTVWLDQGGAVSTANAQRVVLKAIIEWLRARHFYCEAPRLRDGLLVSKTLARPPELLDLAQGPLLLEQLDSVVFHPDPELTYAERKVLQAARQRIQLVTPSTRYRSYDDRANPGAPLTRAALRGKQVALSVSDVVDGDRSNQGLRGWHLDDVVTYLTRALIGGGATIAYGGDFRTSGYDEVFNEVISAYNASGVDQSQFLYSYLPASFEREKVPDGLPANIQALGWTRGVVEQAILAAPEKSPSGARAALFLSDMRRVMAEACFARVIVGGQALPAANGAKRGSGYVGAFPGVVEEAWFTLGCHDRQAGAKPLYLVGGFGGAAGLIAEIYRSGEIPPLMAFETFADATYSEFRQRARDFEHDLDRPRVGAAANQGALAKGVREALLSVLNSDQTARAWNGLSVAENEELFQTRDLVRISTLVMKGLFEVLAADATGKLVIELVPGNIADLEQADAVALSTLQDAPITGAGAVLDAALNNLVTRSKDDRASLVELKSPQIDANWLVLADLGRFDELEKTKLPQIVEGRASELARLALRNDFRRIALATFGATLHEDFEELVRRMLDGFRPLANRTALQWFEIDPGQFKRLHQVLSTHEGVSLTVSEVRPVTAAAPTPVSNDAILFVRRIDAHLHSTLYLPGGAAMSLERVLPFDDAALAGLNRLAENQPSLGEIARIGPEVTELVLGEPGATLLRHNRVERLVIQHDVDSSSIPFEAMTIAGKQPALSKGIVRRPSHRNLSLIEAPPKPTHVDQLKIALVVGATHKLENADGEAQEIRRVLADQHLTCAYFPRAARADALRALSDPTVDILHFVGHAFFQTLDGAGSGLQCVDGALTLEDIRGKQIGPRVVFFNACQSVRLRGEQPPGPQGARAFAEYVLLGGVEAFVGTYWPVRDGAAAHFSAWVYRRLALGDSLGDAVAWARQFLFDGERADWANYALYGNGSFRITNAPPLPPNAETKK